MTDQTGVLYTKSQLTNPKVKLCPRQHWKMEDLGDGYYLIDLVSLDEFNEIEAAKGEAMSFELATPLDPPCKTYIFIYRLQTTAERLNTLEFQFNIEPNTSFFRIDQLSDIKKPINCPEGKYCVILPGFLRNFQRIACGIKLHLGEREYIIKSEQICMEILAILHRWRLSFVCNGAGIIVYSYCKRPLRKQLEAILRKKLLDDKN